MPCNNPRLARVRPKNSKVIEPLLIPQAAVVEARGGDSSGEMRISEGRYGEGGCIGEENFEVDALRCISKEDGDDGGEGTWSAGISSAGNFDGRNDDEPHCRSSTSLKKTVS